MNENNALGYNPDQVKQVFQELENWNNEIQAARCTEFQDKVIVPLSERWFAPEAIKFVEFYIDRTKSYMSEQIACYHVYNEIINEAAQKWAESVGEVYVPYPDNELYLVDKLDSTIMKNSDNGFRGIKGGISELAVVMKALQQRITNASLSLKSVASQSAAFMGAAQMENLNRDIDTSIRWNNEDFENFALAFENGMKETEGKYTQTAQANAQRFSGGN